MKIRNVLSIVLLQITVISGLLAQEAEAKLNKLFTEAKSRNEIPGNYSAIIEDKNIGDFIGIFSKNLADSNYYVRQTSIMLMSRIVEISKEESTQELYIESLTSSLNTVKYLQKNEVLDELLRIQPDIFSEKSKKDVYDYVISEPNVSNNTVLICGHLYLTETINFLKDKLANTSNTSVLLDIRLALARLNDADQVDYLANKIKNIPVDEEVVSSLYPKIIYTRSKKLIDIIVTELNSKEKKCNIPDPEKNEKIECGYRIMELLAPVVKGFPLKTDATGEIDTKDYVSALKISQDWFSKNKEYTLVK